MTTTARCAMCGKPASLERKLLVNAVGILTDYEQKLRTLVNTLADEELFHESTQVAYAEVQKLLAEAPPTAT